MRQASSKRRGGASGVWRPLFFTLLIFINMIFIEGTGTAIVHSLYFLEF